MLKNMLKVTILLTIVQIVFVECANGKKYLILNKETGLVMDGRVGNEAVELKSWVHKDSQLWTFEPTDVLGYYFITNVKTGKVLDVSPSKAILSYNKYGNINQKWLLDSYGYQRLHVAKFPKEFLAYNDDKLQLVSSGLGDESDKWLLIESC